MRADVIKYIKFARYYGLLCILARSIKLFHIKSHNKHKF